MSRKHRKEEPAPKMPASMKVAIVLALAAFAVVVADELARLKLHILETNASTEDSDGVS